MQEVKPKWLDRGLVLVCQKCSAERIPEESPELAAQLGDFDLRDWLKKKLKEDGHWGKIRAISTSCMDVCALGKITVCIDPKTGARPEVIIVDPLNDRKAIYAHIVETLAK